MISLIRLFTYVCRLVVIVLAFDVIHWLLEDVFRHVSHRRFLQIQREWIVVVEYELCHHFMHFCYSLLCSCVGLINSFSDS